MRLSAARAWLVLGGIVMAMVGAPEARASRTAPYSWSIQPTPNPSGDVANSLVSVSCPSTTSCIAVGYIVPRGGGYQTLAESWDGSSWTIQPTPDPSATNSQLTSVACRSASFCVAVGAYSIGNAPFIPLIEIWNGTSWSVQSVPNPAPGQEAELNGVSCAPTVTCMAVGDYANSTKVFAERWNGNAWSLELPPNPAGYAALMVSVSCRVATTCSAVGEVGSGGLEVEGLAEGWTKSGGWVLETAPNPAGANGYLWAVSCPALNTCTAVGSAYSTSSNTLAEYWDGTSWTIQPTPSTGYRLTGVSCTSRFVCVAVGFGTGGIYTPVAYSESRTGWITRHPAFKGSQSDLSGVSCTGPFLCTAVGFYLNSNGVAFTLAERFS